jgi:hypothetical protein
MTSEMNDFMIFPFFSENAFAEKRQQVDLFVQNCTDLPSGVKFRRPP